MGEPECCVIGCKNTAKWHIHGPGGMEDFTHACDEHREEMTPPDVVAVTAIGPDGRATDG